MLLLALVQGLELFEDIDPVVEEVEHDRDQDCKGGAPGRSSGTMAVRRGALPAVIQQVVVSPGNLSIRQSSRECFQAVEGCNKREAAPVEDEQEQQQGAQVAELAPALHGVGLQASGDKKQIPTSPLQAHMSMSIFEDGFPLLTMAEVTGCCGMQASDRK